MLMASQTQLPSANRFNERDHPSAQGLVALSNQLPAQPSGGQVNKAVDPFDDLIARGALAADPSPSNLRNLVVAQNVTDGAANPGSFEIDEVLRRLGMIVQHSANIGNREQDAPRDPRIDQRDHGSDDYGDYGNIAKRSTC
jgi:hypothetical protein